MKQYDYLLIDGNNLFWRAITSFGSGLIYEKRDFNDQVYRKGIKRALDMIKNRDEAFLRDDGKIYFLFDNPVSTINKRKWLSNGQYKHPRKQVPVEFYDLLNQFIDLLSDYDDRFHLLFAEEKEADDLVEPLINYLSERSKILLVSNDMDWARSINERIHWLGNDMVYDLPAFQKKYKFNPKGKKVQVYKSIHGDVSDVIPNALPHLPNKLLIGLVKRYDTIKDLLANYKEDKKIPPQWKDKIREQRKVLESNWKLVDFLEWDKDIGKCIHTCKRDLRQSRARYRALGFQLEPWMIEKKNVMDAFFGGRRKIDVK